MRSGEWVSERSLCGRRCGRTLTNNPYKYCVPANIPVVLLRAIIFVSPSLESTSLLCQSQYTLWQVVLGSVKIKCSLCSPAPPEGPSLPLRCLACVCVCVCVCVRARARVAIGVNGVYGVSDCEWCGCGCDWSWSGYFYWLFRECSIHSKFLTRVPDAYFEI